MTVRVKPLDYKQHKIADRMIAKEVKVGKNKIEAMKARMKLTSKDKGVK